MAIGSGTRAVCICLADNVGAVQAVEARLTSLTAENKQLKQEVKQLKQGELASGEVSPSASLSTRASDEEALTPKVKDLLVAQHDTIQQLKLDLGTLPCTLSQMQQLYAALQDSVQLRELHV